MTESSQGRPLDDASPDLVTEAAEALRSGGIVLLPTETVYGLVARADQPEVLERLRAIKGGRGEKPFARFVANLQQVEQSGARLTAPARRLAERYWPGPLTLVLDHDEGTTGFRVPGLEFTREVIEAAGVPLVATSANRSGEEATVRFDDAMKQVGSEVTLAVDGGETQLRAASTVVQFRSGDDCPPPEILREGFLGRGSIERALTRLVVFVCTGNTCRSPMAEALFRHKLAERLGCQEDQLANLGWQVRSAGVAAGWAAPAAEHSRTLMVERGLSLEDHQSMPLDVETAETAERIVTLTPRHAAAVIDRWPDLSAKVQPLDPAGVPDPIGGDLEVYRECADHIEQRLDILLQEFLPMSDAKDDGLGDLFPQPSSIPPEHDPGTYEHGLRWLVNGEVRTWEGPSEPVESVVCEPDGEGGLRRRVVGHTALLSASAAVQALNAAVGAWDKGRGAWPRSSFAERIKAIRGFCEAVRPHREEVARLLMWEVGKPLKSSLKEFDRTLEYVDDTVAALQDMDRKASAVRNEGGILGVVRQAPLGVVLCMGPFNYPLNETYTTVLPALAMGNTIVLKLPKMGMLCNLPLLDALAEHFPPGVVNVISGDGRELITPIISSGKVDVLAFIGSSKVAGIIEKQHPAPWRLTTVLGMDAKNPAIVLPSADLDTAIKHCLKGSTSFNGQRCTALKILFVHRSLADTFVERFSQAVEDLSFGMPWEDGVSITPLPEKGKAEWLQSLVDDAVSKGAKVQNPRGGSTRGTFYFPTVLYPVSKDAQLYTVEQFGPLIPIVPFDDVSEVQESIAASDYGQQVSVFGQDPQALGPLIDMLANQVCRINLNRYSQRGPDTFPFAGRKNSAEGVLSVTDALEAFSIPSMVAAGEEEGKDVFESILDTKSSNFLRRES